MLKIVVHPVNMQNKKKPIFNIFCLCKLVPSATLNVLATLLYHFQIYHNLPLVNTPSNSEVVWKHPKHDIFHFLNMKPSENYWKTLKEHEMTFIIVMQLS